MAEESKIDQNLYSRQIGVYGLETMGKLIQTDVLIIGLQSLGVETAKNLILAGPRSVAVYDRTATTAADVGTNFYLTDADIGKPRDAACVAKLAELNPYVTTTVLKDDAITESVLKRFKVVVATNTPMKQLLQWNEICRSQKPAIGFIAADVRGVAGYAFSDFGPEFSIVDKDGEQAKTAVVVGVTQSNPGVVFCDDKKRIAFAEGDSVVFSEVEGMTELNDGKPRVVRNVKAHSFEIEDTSGYGTYINGGLATQAKVPTVRKFVSLAEARENPIVPYGAQGGMMITPDLAFFDRSQQLHIAFGALDAFHDKHGRYPEVRNGDEAKEVVALAEDVNKNLKGGQVEKVDAEVVRRVALLSAVELPALSTVFGGVVAQEVVKFTGKFTPLGEFLYLDALLSVPEAARDVTRADDAAGNFAPDGTRQDVHYAIFGKDFIAKLANQKVFLVGAGALGCEFLKNFAMMGVCVGGDGRLTVTDMDNIEVSNLNRQFLFRSGDVGKPKSVTAGAAVQAMNPALKVEALETPVGNDTEDTFHDDFWDGLNIVVNALDNVQARRYVDSKCVFHQKPLLESGTLGTKANVQVVLPHQTESYGDSVDPPEESIPMCTLHNFPNQIEHCIEWARDIFEKLFTTSIQDAKAFVDNPSEWLSQTREEENMHVRRTKLQGVKDVLVQAQSASWENCVKAAVEMYHQYFYLNIRQLLYNFPLDKTDESGNKFWSGSKRPPQAIPFDSTNPMALDYVHASAHILADSLGVQPSAEQGSPEGVAKIASTVDLPEFKPKTLKIKESEEDKTEEGAEDDREVAQHLTEELRAKADRVDGFKGVNLNPSSFEKDDDSNHHIDFITACANLRAANYTIKPASRHRAKMIAGKIIPAIATTTASVTGFVCLELYKVVDNVKIDYARDGYLNLAINLFSQSEPAPARKHKSGFSQVLYCEVKARPEGFTNWDQTVVEGSPDMTFNEFAQKLKETQNAEVSMVTYGEKMLFAPDLYPEHKERGDKSILKVIEEAFGKPMSTTRKYLVLSPSVVDVDTGDELMIPTTVIKLK